MPQLFPVFELPGRAPAAAPAAPAYGKDLAFDLAAGDLVLDGSGRPVLLDGWSAWVQWCAKTVLTERFSYLAYSHRYGCELQAARQARDRQAAEAELARAITEALMSDPRTESVRDFTFRWEGDAVHVSCTVRPVAGPPAGLEVKLLG